MAIRDKFSDAVPDATENKLVHGRVVSYSLVIISALAVLFPLYWMATTSMKIGQEVTIFPPTLIPHNPSIQPYFDALQSGPWLTWFLNTTFVSLGATLFVLSVAAPAAYALARREFTGARLFFMLFMSTMMIPGQILLIPLFVMFAKVGLVNSHVGLILAYGILFTGFTIFVLHGFFKTLPTNIEDAARVAGISEWKILTHVILPLTKPGLATAAVFVFVFSWNEFLFALVMLQQRSQYTISVGLSKFFGIRGSVELNQLMAISTLAVIPVVLLFALMQKQFVEGITTGFRE